MEFKSIVIKNFLSYFDENEIEFSDTTTIFIGQNNTVKSKIFDAINFALYERIWITDKGENGAWIDSDKEISTFILNNHKKNIAVKENEENIDVSVSLVMDDGNSFITVERVYLYKKTDSGFEYKSKNFSLTVADPITGNISTYMGQEATDNQYHNATNKNGNRLVGATLPFLEDDTPYVRERNVQRHEYAERQGGERGRCRQEAFTQRQSKEL